MMSMDELPRTIQAFLTKTGMAPTAFGLAALKDPNFVFDLMNGKREPRRKTVQKVCAFIEANDPKKPTPQPRRRKP